MPRSGSGVYSKPAGTTAVPNTTITSSQFNTSIDDIAADLNFPRPIASGGTGAANVADARDNLGLEIGADVQGYDPLLAAIAALTTSADKLIYSTGPDAVSLTPITSFARTILDDADAATMRETLGAASSAITITSSGNGVSGGGSLSSNRVITLNLGALPVITAASLASPRAVVTNGSVAGSQSMMEPDEFLAAFGAASRAGDTFTGDISLNNSSAERAYRWTNSGIKIYGNADAGGWVGLYSEVHGFIVWGYDNYSNILSLHNNTRINNSPVVTENTFPSRSAAITQNMIGSVAMLKRTSPGTFNQGDTSIGSALLYSNADGSVTGNNPDGTWLCLGKATGGAAGGAGVTMWKRIS